MTEERLDEVLDKFNKAGDGEPGSLTEKEFEAWVEKQPDSDAIYEFFNSYVQELIDETEARAEKEEIERVRLQLIEQSQNAKSQVNPMSITYISGTEDTIIMNLGGSAVATHAEKHGITKAEAYQIRSEKAEVTTLKKEFPEMVNLTRENAVHISKDVTLSNGSVEPVAITIMPRGNIAKVAIEVGGSVSRDPNLSQSDGVKLALQARKMFRDAAKKLPDGAVLLNTPNKSDGLGENRRKLYEQAGFFSESDRPSMMAIVKNGKLKPLSVKNLRKLEKADHYKI